MPKVVKELTALQVKHLKKVGLTAVGGVAGLYITISKSGSRSWILRTKIGCERTDLGIGSCSLVSLAEARDKARDLKKLILEGIDPRIEKRRRSREVIEKSKPRVTFMDAAIQCHQSKQSEFRNVKHRKDWISSLERHAFPIIGQTPVETISTADVMSVVGPIWHTKTETATRIRQRIESVLKWATVSELREGLNPARWDSNLEELLPNPSKIRTVKHFKAVPFKEAPDVFKKIQTADGMGAKALQFTILTTSRPSEVRFAEWNEIDLSEQVWTIQAPRMKEGLKHRVPLSEAAICLLKSLPRFKDCNLLFPSSRGKVLSDATMNAVLKRINVNATTHGFRSTFKDWSRAMTNYADEVSELCLAHVNSDSTRAAYARDELLDLRKQQLEDWALYLDCEFGAEND
jgi:integrase